jgi:hypothetical protein
MKTCSYCGAEYADDAVTCTIDQTPLESSNPAPAAKPTKSQEPLEAPKPPELQDSQDQSAPSQKAEDESAPNAFQSLGIFNAFQANRLLKRFTEATIRFEIDRVDRREQSGRGTIRTVSYIEIFVHNDDHEEAYRILTEDWKV